MCPEDKKTIDNLSAEEASMESVSSGRTLDLLKKINQKTIDPKSIKLDDRRQIVAHLMAQGYSTVEMGEIFHVSDRCIERDRKAIREANAIKADSKLVEIMAGRLICQAESTIHGMLKAARSETATPAVRIEAHHRSFLVVRDLIQQLQSLGYLPTAARKLEAEVVHHVSEVPQLPEIEAEVKRLAGLLPQESEQLGQVQDEITRAKLATKVEEISTELPEKGEQNESDE